MSTASESLSEALAAVKAGTARTRPVSFTLPVPLADALQQLAEEGAIASASAAATEALTQWAYNRLLRMTLDEVYEDQPDLRPSREQLRRMARKVGARLPDDE